MFWTLESNLGERAATSDWQPGRSWKNNRCFRGGLNENLGGSDRWHGAGRNGWLVSTRVLFLAAARFRGFRTVSTSNIWSWPRGNGRADNRRGFGSQVLASDQKRKTRRSIEKIAFPDGYHAVASPRINTTGSCHFEPSTSTGMVLRRPTETLMTAPIISRLLTSSVLSNRRKLGAAGPVSGGCSPGLWSSAA